MAKPMSMYRYQAMDADGHYFVEMRGNGSPIGVIFQKDSGWSYKGANGIHKTRDDAALACQKHWRRLLR